MSAALSTGEQLDLTALETVVHEGLATFIEVGQALAEIRDRRLYRTSHATFEEYAHDRWVLSRTRAYQLIDAANVGEVMSTMVDTTPPANERQARELAPLKDDEQAMIGVWRDLRERHGDRLSAHLVKVEVDRQLNRVPKVECPGCGRAVAANRLRGGRLYRMGQCKVCGSKIPVEETISTYEPDSPRKQQIANRVKFRVEVLVGTCSALKRGLPDLRLERAVAVATDEEVAGWIEVIEAGVESLEEVAAWLKASRNGDGL